jgi:hypothetical protein
VKFDTKGGKEIRVKRKDLLQAAKEGRNIRRIMKKEKKKTLKSRRRRRRRVKYNDK